MHRQNDEMVFEVLHLFCGSGGAALGMQQSAHQYKGLNGRFHTVLGIDNDPYCCTDFERLTGSPAACMNLFSREQYIDFHGKQPSEDWREVAPSDIRQACRNIYPDVVFLSPP
ncbi:MAG: DNA cytosine methyltransferase, partial [Lutispora sp.]|nr:DNA cytosine methyltransferase [Lutispora sp.]